jgi:hypothetical protein
MKRFNFKPIAVLASVFMALVFASCEPDDSTAKDDRAAY